MDSRRMAISLLIGILSTLTGAAILRGYFPFMNLFNQNSLAGTWVSEYEDETGERYNEKIKVRQAFHKIYATAQLTRADQYTETQKIKGTYKNQILTAEYWSTEKNAIERGTFTLRRIDRNTLEGYFTFFMGAPVKQHQSRYVWIKQKD